MLRGAGRATSLISLTTITSQSRDAALGHGGRGLAERLVSAIEFSVKGDCFVSCVDTEAILGTLRKIIMGMGMEGVICNGIFCLLDDW